MRKQIYKKQRNKKYLFLIKLAQIKPNGSQ